MTQVQVKGSVFSLRPRLVAVLLVIFVTCNVGNVKTLFAQGSSDLNLQEVEVSGAGTDIEAAKKDACREAVRRVVGAYVNSETRTENDELIEDNVISLSSGFVEKMETLKESKADGLVRVRIRATVRTSKVLDSLKKNRISVSAADGESLGAQLVTIGDQKKGEAELIAAAFDEFPLSCFKASVDGKPRLGEQLDSGSSPVIVTVVIEPDLDAFAASAVKLEKALSAAERPHGEFQVDGAKCGFGRYSQNEAGDRLRYEFTSGVNSDRHPATAVLAFIDGREAFPSEVRDFMRAGSSAGPPRIMPLGVLPLMFPVKFIAGGKRSTWKWYGVKFEDAKKYFRDQFGKIVTCQTSLLDSQGNEIAIEDWQIPLLGIGGMEYWEGYSLEVTGLQPIIVAPAVIPPSGAEYLFPKFSCERTFLLDEDEISTIAKVSVALK